MTHGDKAQILDGIYDSLVLSRRAELTYLVAQQTAGIVQSGPFRGMRLSVDASWGDGDIVTKLLGVYEQELHIALNHFATKSYGAVVNVGCAEGYYAVGLSRCFPDLPVVAFDINPKAQSLCRATAQANGRAENVIVKGSCTAVDIQVITAAYKPIFGMIDCEGFELELLTSDLIAGPLRTSDFIIECHDFMQSGITETLKGRFKDTHIVVDVRAGGRDPNALGLLRGLKDSDRWLMMSEGRPCVMNWLICEALSRE